MATPMFISAGVSNLFYTTDQLRFRKKSCGPGGVVFLVVAGVFKTGLFIYTVISMLK